MLARSLFPDFRVSTIECWRIVSTLRTTTALNVVGVFCVLWGAAVSCAWAQQDVADQPIATVNGEPIPYSRYDRARLTRLRNIGKSEHDTTALDAIENDAILLSLIDEVLTRQVAEKKGIVVTKKDAIETLVANPPDYIREIFTDTKGKFRPELLKSVINSPKDILKFVGDPNAPKRKIVREWQEDIQHLVRYFQTSETRQRLVDALYAEDPLTDSEIKWRYFAEQTMIEGSVIRVLHSTVPDSLVPVSDQEVRDWYEEHKEEYRIPESRYVSSLIFPVVPSSQDSARVRERVDRAVQTIENAPLSRRLGVVNDLIASLPPNRVPVTQMISPKAFEGEIRNDLAMAHMGDLIGPYPVEKESLLLYVADEQSSADTLIRARQILFSVTPEMTPEQVAQQMHLAEQFRDSIDNEAEFVEAARYFENDPRGDGNGGDLGYGGRGLYVREFDSALFAAPIGVPVGPIRTRFGYHLIWVKDKQARQFALRELRFPIEASPAVKDEVEADAAAYAQYLRSGRPLDSIHQAMKMKYPGLIVDSGSVLKRLEPYGDILETNEFAFTAEIGDVGIFTLPYDRIAVMELGHVWRAGVPSFEDVIAYPVAHARRKKQLDTLETRLAHLTDQITPEMLLGPIRERAPMAEVYELKRQPIIQMPDEDPVLLDSLVAATDNGGVSGPVRGTHGLYFLRVARRYGPSNEDYRREKTTYSAEYRERYRRQLLETALLDARHYATIEVE